MIPRMTGSPFVHRVLAFALAIFGGQALGLALRRVPEGPLLDFGPLYVGAWMIRSGAAWADLYDPAHLARAVVEIAPAGRILDLGATPPLLVALALPFTPCTATFGKFLWAICGVLVLLGGLGALGAGRVLGWNRSEWVGLAGLVLGSQAASEAVVRGSAAPWAFGLLAAAVGAHGLGRPLLAAGLSSAAALATPLGFGPLAFSFVRGPRGARLLAVVSATAGFGLVAALLGPRGISRYLEAWRAEWITPGGFDPSWPAVALRAWPGGGPWLPATTGLAVGLLILLFARRCAQLPALRDWTRDAPRPRPNFDPPTVSGIAPALLAGLLLVATVQPLRGAGLAWALPIWAGLSRLEAQRATGAGLALVALAVLVLLPAPLAARLGPETSAWLGLAGSLGLLLWWWRDLRDFRPTAR
jgi:hypothetical protein